VQVLGGQLVSLSGTTTHGFQDVTAAVQIAGQNTERGIHALLGGAQDVITTVATRADQMSEQVMISDLSSAMRHTDTTAALVQVSTAAKGRLRAVDRGLSRVHRGQGRLSRQQVSSTAQIMNSIQSASNTVSREIASLARGEHEGKLSFEGASLEVLTRPLTLMEPELVRAIETLIQERKMSLPLKEACWVKLEFDSLLADASQASAQAVRHSLDPSTSGRRSKVVPTGSRAQAWRPFPSPDDHVLEPNDDVDVSDTGIISRNHNHRSVIRTPAGTLVIQSDRAISGESAANVRST
jgi:hypothetical protein